MIPSQVNRLRALAALTFLFGCARANGNRNAAESATATRRETTTVAAAQPAPKDSNITRADLARIQGSATAPVWVVMVSDFQCPFCKQWEQETYPKFRDEFVKTGKVRLAYVNFPLDSHVHAFPAAEAAMCAGAQGKFWEMHDALFATQAKWESLESPARMFDSLAVATGVDAARWRDCISTGKMKSLIRADHDRASVAGASATPSFLIGDKMLIGAQPIEQLRLAVAAATARNAVKAP